MLKSSNNFWCHHYAVFIAECRFIYAIWVPHFFPSKKLQKKEGPEGKCKPLFFYGNNYPGEYGGPDSILWCSSFRPMWQCWQRGSASSVWVSSGHASPGSLTHRVSDGVLSSEGAPSSFSWWRTKTHLQQCFVNTGFWAAPVPLSRYHSFAGLQEMGRKLVSKIHVYWNGRENHMVVKTALCG